MVRTNVPGGGGGGGGERDVLGGEVEEGRVEEGGGEKGRRGGGGGREISRSEDSLRVRNMPTWRARSGLSGLPRKDVDVVSEANQNRRRGKMWGSWGGGQETCLEAPDASLLADLEILAWLLQAARAPPPAHKLLGRGSRGGRGLGGIGAGRRGGGTDEVRGGESSGCLQGRVGCQGPHRRREEEGV